MPCFWQPVTFLLSRWKKTHLGSFRLDGWQMVQVRSLFSWTKKVHRRPGSRVSTVRVHPWWRRRTTASRRGQETRRRETDRKRERETEREERRDCRQEMASLALGLPTAVAAAAEKSAKELGLRSSNGYFRQAWQQQQLPQRMRGGQVPGVSSLALCRAHQQQQQQKKLEPEASFGAGRTVRSVILPLFAAALVG